ncbi:glucans biosynthesis glucosyltransferase MdoH [Haematobacter genomosp. 1]|uniref:Glucans biosynthesis glucosyltransferase H n=1 Tax=Haematobacter genomosp. 1 TaxID=366618 RepID=A0A212AG37_9RHOB|nr:glucans biosynthesis glucosyltransferase MdoH [Haematobacter genomosp. 1]OWJ80482.1 glucan biosynthesis glucosyltransferase H [Haematobacter genomosp. 1]
MILRTVLFLASLVLAGTAVWLGLNVFFADGRDGTDYVRIALLGLTTWWIAWGAMLGMSGVFMSSHIRRARTTGPLTTRTAILLPVYNEPPEKPFSHAAAMIESLEATGLHGAFELAIVSDTTRAAIGAEEEAWFEKLRGGWGHILPVYYRRRTDNTGKKAGNIAEFIRRFGGRYDFLIILDADSLMEGETLVEMVRRMEAEPKLGLLQTLPKIIRSRSFFGRVLQFSAAFFSPIFTRGVAALQGREGPFWGHNAITRTTAFAESCGLPELKGKPPFGGHILSHDYVEAALLARAGWIVRVDPDIGGSYEEAPDNILDYAKRDRRWAQGNLQHSRLLAVPGLKMWSRFVFFQGIMAYLASSLWGVFLIATILAPILAAPFEFFPDSALGVPQFPISESTRAILLLLLVLGLLLGPKLLIALRSIFDGRARQFGGAVACLASVIIEILWSSLIAPLMLAFQTRSVIEILTGADGGWPVADREAQAIPLSTAWKASWWITATGAVILFAAWKFTNLFIWFLPVGGPMLIAPLIIAWSSDSGEGASARRLRLFMTPEEQHPRPVMIRQQEILNDWRREEIASPGPDSQVTAPPAAALATEPTG